MISTEECKPKILASCAVQGLVRSCPPGMEVGAGKQGNYERLVGILTPFDLLWTKAF